MDTSGKGHPTTPLPPHIRQALLQFQKAEITEHHVYHRLAQRAEEQNRAILERISQDELRHYRIWARYTGQEFRPDRFRVFLYLLAARLLSLTFAVKLMERNEARAETAYAAIQDQIPEAATILQEEEQHENQLISILDEERLAYIGSMILGLNDALVELTGALAGLTFALQNPHLVGLAGIITGISASFSMAASEYLSTKSESEDRIPWKAALYTGTVYLLTVLLLVIPFLLLPSPYVALALALVDAVLLILLFTFFISVVREIPFGRNAGEMIAISLGVALLSFGIGLLARQILPVE